MEGVKIINSGEGQFNKTSDMLKMVRNVLIPELAEDVGKKAARVKELMEKELSRGPLKVQALDYGKGKKKRRK